MLGQIAILVCRKAGTVRSPRFPVDSRASRVAKAQLDLSQDSSGCGLATLATVNTGPGHRVCFGGHEVTIMILLILLCAGDKGSQAKDIATAK